jgi:hypothetical protein
VLASDEESFHYFHNDLALPLPTPTPPTKERRPRRPR